MFSRAKTFFSTLSFRWKAIIFIASIEALFNIMFAIIVVSVMQNNLEEQFFKRAQSSAETFATTNTNAILATDIASLESFSQEVLKNKDLRYIRIFDTSGVLVEKSNDPSLLRQSFKADTNLSQVDDDIFDTFIEVSEGGEVYGRIELGLSTNLLGSTITNIQLKVIIIGVSEILFSAFISFLLGAFLVRRLVVLQESSHRIAEGELGIQINDSGHDEIAETAKAFNHMSKETAKLVGDLKGALNEVNFQKFALDQHAIVSISDVDGNITYVNEKFCKTSGYTEEELIGHNHRIIKSDEHDNDYFEKMWLTISSGEVWHGTFKNKDKNDQYFWVESTIVPFLDDNNKPFQYISIRTDITKRIKLEEDLKIEKKKAEAANRAKSEFLAVMSHEIRTPMNGVIGMTGLLLETELDKEQLHFAETIRNSGDALLLIINDILDYSKLEANKMDFELTPFSLNVLIEGVAEIQVPKAYEKGLEINYYIEPDLRIEFLGDSGRLRQILMNLVGNAVKFTESGTVIIQIVKVKQSKQQMKLRFEVTDTGIGITEEYQKKLFSSFTQEDVTTARKYGGTGLGLAISKQLIEAMGGDIGVISQLGEGTTFWFELELPIERREQNIDRDMFADVLSKRRVLVLDDNLINCEILEKTLSFWKINAETEIDVEIAITKAKKAAEEHRPYDLILTDYSMPHKNGVEFIREIRDLKAYQKTPIILISSMPIKDNLQSEAKHLSDAQLLKPTRNLVLYDAIVSVLGFRKEVEKRVNKKKIKKLENKLSLRILVAEDNTVNQMVAKKMLTGMGHNVDIVANGLEALNAVHDFPYDLIFMDMQMPEMDGLAATRAIRALDDQVSKIPIIAMTANATIEFKEQCIEAGMDDFITKPVQRNIVEDAIKSILTSKIN